MHYFEKTCDAAAASGFAPTPTSCCRGANRFWPLGPGVSRLVELNPTLAEELQISNGTA